MRLLDRLPGFVSHIWCAVLFFFGWLLFAVTGLSNVEVDREGVGRHAREAADKADGGGFLGEQRVGKHAGRVGQEHLLLGFWKYQGFLAQNINAALGEEFLADLQLALPTP